MTASAGRSRVAIAGYAQSPIRRHGSVPLGALTMETCLRAIADAGLTPADIDGLTTGSLLPSSGGQAIVDGQSIVTSSYVAEHLGIHPRFAAGFQGYGQLSGSVMLAVDAIVSGSAECVLLHRALGNPPGRYNVNPMTEAEGAAQWSAPYGFWGAPTHIALIYQEYMQRYGAKREEMAAVVVEARRNGADIPWSYWHGRPITVDDYMNARMIADPICVLDCDIPVEGAAAFVLTSAERARDLPHRPVYVAGFAHGHPIRPSGGFFDLDDVLDGGAVTGRRLFEHAGVSRADVDLPELYDGFSPLLYFWLESLGYCGRGEAHQFVQDGRISSAGSLPVLSSGGALGNGRMHGVPQMLECYLQLSGRAGPRQRAGVSVALACHAYPHLGGAVVYTAEPG